MYGSYSGYGSNSAMNSLLRSSSASSGNSVWIIISAVVAVIGGIVLYFTFLAKNGRIIGEFRVESLEFRSCR